MPRMTGKRALLEQLIADGVRHVFGNPGTTEQGFMDVQRRVHAPAVHGRTELRVAGTAAGDARGL